MWMDSRFWVLVLVSFHSDNDQSPPSHPPHCRLSLCRSACLLLSLSCMTFFLSRVLIRPFRLRPNDTTRRIDSDTQPPLGHGKHKLIHMHAYTRTSAPMDAMPTLLSPKLAQTNLWFPKSRWNGCGKKTFVQNQMVVLVTFASRRPQNAAVVEKKGRTAVETETETETVPVS